MGILTNIRRINLRAVIVSLLLLVPVTTFACGTGGPTEEELRGEVVTALDALAADLAEDRPIDEDAYMESLRSYLDAPPHSTGAPRRCWTMTAGSLLAPMSIAPPTATPPWTLPCRPTT